MLEEFVDEFSLIWCVDDLRWLILGHLHSTAEPTAARRQHILIFPKVPVFADIPFVKLLLACLVIQAALGLIV